MNQSLEPAMEQAQSAPGSKTPDELAARNREFRRKILSIAIQVAAIFFGLAVGAILIVFSGANPIVAYKAVVVGAFGSSYNILETLVKATPLLLIGLGITVAFRASVWNMGSEGQLRMGAMAAAAVGIMLFDSTLPKVILVGLLMLAGFFGGGAWGALAGWIKVRFKVSEVVATIMMNFIAAFFVNWMITNPLQDANAGGTAITSKIVEGGYFTRFFSQAVLGSRLHVGFVVGLVAAVFVYIFLWRTVPGYQIRAVGANREASRLAGINVNRNTVLALVIGGGLAGLAGMSEVAGLHHRLIEGFSPGFGSSGLLVGLMGKLHPAGVVLAAILFGGLIVGTDAMTRAVDVPGSIVFVIQGAVVLSMLAGEQLVRYWRITE